jgi:glycosyltransferase involved in cell wall biosynthesis
MRVIHIVKAKGIAGAERHLLDLLSGLRERDIDARIILLAEPNTTADSFHNTAEARGIPVQRVTIFRHLDPGLWGRLCAVLRELRPDIVHTHLLHADFYGIPAARLAGIRTVITSRHNDDPRNGRFPLRQTQWALWRMVSAGIAISNAVKRHNLEVEGAPPKKVRVIYYGLPLPVEKIEKAPARRALRAEIGAEADAPLVGMICRLMDAKGIPDALNAFARIAPEFPTARFVLAGEGPLRDELEAQVRALNLVNRVHFLGWRDQPMQTAAALDILLSPSVREGFGLTMLEAMAQAIPIIGSTASAIPEIVVNGQTGLTVPPRDPEALADAMRTLLADKPLRMHMGLLGEERLETTFSASRMIEETLQVYRSLLQR